MGEPGTEENPQGTIWADDQIEKVEKPKKKRERKPGFLTVTFTKIKAAGEMMGEKVKDVAYELYQDLAEDEPEETKE